MSQSRRRAAFRAKGLPDPGPTPSVEMSVVEVLMPRTLAKLISDRYEAMERTAKEKAIECPSRSELVCKMIVDGLV